MNYSLNFGLKGQYKVDLYSGKKLVETTDWFSNDITNWGLNYPFDYSFARCFMFLSLGNTFGTNNKESTGLSSPISKFKVKGVTGISEQSGQYVGWQGYEIGGDKNASSNPPSVSTCGTIFNKKGMSMYRGWTIPTGNSNEENVLEEPLLIKQLMLSPSSGLDSKGNKAFSLVNRDITIPSGYSATITYQLSIELQNYSSPYTFFSGKKGANTNGFFETGQAYTGKDNSELHLLSGWSNLSGIFRQITPGFEIVDQFGACVRPKMGNELEPYLVNCYNTFFYLSPDISQFSLSKYGTYINQNEAYNSIGLLANYEELVRFEDGDLDIKSDQTQAIYSKDNLNKWFYSGENDKVGESVYESNTIKEIDVFPDLRLTNLTNIQNYKTGTLDFSYKTLGYTGAINYPIAYATPGKVGINLNFEDFGQKFVRSTYLKRMPVDPNIKNTTTRFKYITKKAIIPPLYCYGTNSRYGSLTLSYAKSLPTDLTNINNLEVNPYIDFLFFDTEGRAANMSHYRYVPSIYLKDRGTGVSKIRFDIVSETGEKLDHIKRFYSGYGFMGNGVDAAENSTGLNVNHLFLTGEKISNGSNYFVPPGEKTSGFLFPGQILNSGVQGDISYNKGTGYGSVYGIIANSGFYLSPYDLCLLDIPNWSGLGGDPSETICFGYTGSTGFSGNLCWPHYSKKIKLQLSELEYYVPGIGSIPDPNGVFGTNQERFILDITGYVSGTGISLFKSGDYLNKNNTNSFIWLTDENGFPLSGSGLSTGPGKKYQDPFILISGNGRAETGYINVGTKTVGALFTTGFAIFSGFSGNIFRFSGLNLSSSQIENLSISGSCKSGYPIKFKYGPAHTAPSIDYNPYINFKCVPDNLKRPEAYIYHVESTGNDMGYRMLPNYGVANTGTKNTYTSITGGTFPGLSTENGMELFLTLTWSGL